MCGKWPNLVQCPGSVHRADNIIAPLDDRTRNVSYLVNIVQQLSVGVKEATVDKVVAEFRQCSVTIRVDNFLKTGIYCPMNTHFAHIWESTNKLKIAYFTCIFDQSETGASSRPVIQDGHAH